MRICDGPPEVPLQCELIHADFRKTPYETVSYCWGDPRDTTCVEIDGCTVEIPYSAAEALLHLRLIDEDRMIWIDSLCINQRDTEERGQQVAKMHDIYGHGARNLIWLGADDGTVGTALSTVTRIVAEIKSETNDFKAYEDAIRPYSGRIGLSSSGFSFDFDAEPLLRFFARP